MTIAFNKTTAKAPVQWTKDTVEFDDDIPFDLDAESAEVASSDFSANEVDVSLASVDEKPPLQPTKNKFAYSGGTAKAAFEKAEDQQLMPWRFFMKVGETRKITFLDGVLDQTGFFINRSIFEHSIRIGNTFPTYACTENCPDPKDNEPCPLCLQDKPPYMVGFFTVIDHTPYTNPKTGKVTKDVTRVFAAKRRVMSMLLMIAKKRGGIAGCRFDVMRLENQSNTGEVFDFIKQFPVDKLCEKYKTQPYDPEIVTNYKSREELLAMGFGGMPIGAQNSPVITDGHSIDTDLDL
jgi:hypothetical protein